MTNMINFDHFLQYYPKYIEGLWLTLKMSAISLIAAFLIAVVLVLLGMVKINLIKNFIRFYISFFRGVPILVQFFLIHYALPGLVGDMFTMTAVTSGCITFSMNSAAYLAEAIRGGLSGVDKGQYEAAKALGVSNWMVMFFIVSPQALRVVLPSLINTCIMMIKDSAIVSQVGTFDLTRAAYFVSSRTYNSMEAFLFSAIFYLAIILLLTFLSRFVERYCNRYVTPV